MSILRLESTSYQNVSEAIDQYSADIAAIPDGLATLLNSPVAYITLSFVVMSLLFGVSTKFIKTPSRSAVAGMFSVAGSLGFFVSTMAGIGIMMNQSTALHDEAEDALHENLAQVVKTHYNVDQVKLLALEIDDQNDSESVEIVRASFDTVVGDSMHVTEITMTTHDKHDILVPVNKDSDILEFRSDSPLADVLNN